MQKLPPSIAKSIDESNYVKLSSLTAALSSSTINNKQNGSEPVESDKINELDSKANLLNNLYHVNNNNNNNNQSTKTILSIVNQKNINNLNNLLNKTNLNGNNNVKANDSITDIKAGLINNVDFNKNGLPPSNTIVPNIDTPTKLNGNFNRNSQSYVIQSMGTCPINGNEMTTTKGKCLFSLYLFTFVIKKKC